MPDKIRRIYRHGKKYRAIVLIVGILISMTIGFQRSSQSQAVVYTPVGSFRAKDFAVVRQGATWHAFAIYCEIGNGNCQDPYPGLMHLTSTDLTNWTEIGYVIPPGTVGAWDYGQTWAPSIVEKDGTYYMFYTGTTGSTQKIGLVTSTDLNNWVKYGSNPVVDCTIFSWVFGTECRDPYVMWDDTERQWVMFMSSVSTEDGSAPPWINHPATIGIATSDDLVNWYEYGFVQTADDYTAESAHVILHSGTYYLVMTDNCGSGQCLRYMSSTNLYSGYGAQTDVPTDGSPGFINEFASEYFTNDGREYFADIEGDTNVGLQFRELIWPGSPFVLQDISYAAIGDTVWNDADGGGTQNGGEAGIDNVTVKLYFDNGVPVELCQKLITI